jgi:hypothetical protein
MRSTAEHPGGEFGGAGALGDMSEIIGLGTAAGGVLGGVGSLHAVSAATAAITHHRRR